MHVWVGFVLWTLIYEVKASQLENCTSDCVQSDKSLYEDNKFFHTYNNETATLSISLNTSSFTGIDRYEVLLYGTRGKTEMIPSNCLQSPSLLHHSAARVTPCGTSSESPVPLQCIKDRAFTVKFDHVYTGYYCYLITPYEGMDSKRPLWKKEYFETSLNETGIESWNTTIDIQSFPKQQQILVSFVNAASEYNIKQFQVNLFQGTCCHTCGRGKAWKKQQIAVEPDKQNIDAIFSNVSRGLYCVVVTPIDFRCEGSNNLWTVNGTCARYSQLNYQSGDISRNGSTTFPPTINAVPKQLADWVIVLIWLLFLTVIGTVTFIVFIIRRNKKTVHMLNWKKSLDEVDCEKPRNRVFDKERRELVLLYTKDISTKVADFRAKLQYEGFTVYDYGDPQQQEALALEGVDWLPNRLNRSRVIFFYCSESILNLKPTYDLERDPDKFYLNESNSSSREKLQLLGECNTIDRHYFFGVKLLSSLRPTLPFNYRRVFRARFADDHQLDESSNFITPFTLFLLPNHFDKLVQHLLD